MEVDHTLFVANHVLMIISGGLGFLLLVTLGVLFFVSRRSQKVMQSLLTLMTRPERAKVSNATRVLQTILADEIAKIQANFQSMSDTLAAQIASAQELKHELSTHNENLVNLAGDATKRLAQMSQRLDNTVTGLQSIVESPGWSDVENSADRFTANINELLGKIDTTTQDTTERTNQIQAQIDSWNDASGKMSQQLQADFDRNTAQMKTMTDGANEMQGALTNLAQTTTDGFKNV